MASAEEFRVRTCSVHGLGRISCIAAAPNGSTFLGTDSAIYCLSSETARDGGGGKMVRIAGHVTDEGFRDGRGTEARFRGPRGLSMDRDGKAVLVADTGNDVIRKISVVGTEMMVSTLAGCADTAGFVDGVAHVARFNRPAGIAVDTAGVILVTDSRNHALRAISPVDGHVTTLAGGSKGFEDGTSATARFNSPFGIDIDRGGNAIVADVANHCIRLVSRSASSCVVKTIAGRGEMQGFGDGDGDKALFNNPRDVAVEGRDRILVADASNHMVRMVSREGEVTTVAGSGEKGQADGCGAAAALDRPWALSLDNRGRLLVACFNTFGRLRVVEVAFPWRMARILYIGVLKTRGASNARHPPSQLHQAHCDPALDSRLHLPASTCLLALLPTEGDTGLICPLLDKILGVLDCGFLSCSNLKENN